MGGVSPETCWSSCKYEIKIFIHCCILLNFFVNYAMMHGFFCELYYDARIFFVCELYYDARIFCELYYGARIFLIILWCTDFLWIILWCTDFLCIILWCTDFLWIILWCTDFLWIILWCTDFFVNYTMMHGFFVNYTMMHGYTNIKFTFTFFLWILNVTVFRAESWIILITLFYITPSCKHCAASLWLT